MIGSACRAPETYSFDFKRRRFPAWFRPEESTRQAAVVSYMHAHQLSLSHVYAKAGCARHFCTYRYTQYDDPAEIPGPVSSCGWIDPASGDPGCRIPQGFVFRPGRAVPILPTAFDRVPDRATPIKHDSLPSPRFAGGTGAREDPYLISSAEDLLLLSYLSNHRVRTGIDPTLAEEIGDDFTAWSRDKYFRLTRDVVWNDPAGDPAAGVPFPMICNRNAEWGERVAFFGNIDGDGHFIRGLCVSEESERGFYPDGDYNYGCGVSFIGTFRGTVKKLAITDSTFSGSSRVAAFAGTLVGGTIENCLSDNRILVRGAQGDRNGGGLVGYSASGTISRSVVGGEILGSVYSNVSFLGGILGAVATGGNMATRVTDSFVFATVRERLDPTVRRDYPAFLALHDEKRVEILRITEGVLNLLIGKHRYVGLPGSVYVVNPYDFFQTFVSPTDAERTSVEFFSFALPQFCQPAEASLLYPVFSELPGRPVFSNEIKPGDPGAPGIAAALDYLFGKSKNAPSPVPSGMAEELRVRAGLLRFVSEAAEHGLMSLSAEQKEQKNARFRSDMIEWIEENYRGKLTTETAANRFFLSKSYFCRRFRQEFGLPFAIYLQNFRIRKSKRLDPAKFPSLSALAASVGFPSYYHFERVFRQWMGMTPRAYFDAARRTVPSPFNEEDDAIEK
ncbi:MAG: helix-turn-helix transcriptional regulator [Clostridia bacterium]|nr:helix-turn-helix transcriptional regulator [Clostridia bacterium]